MSEDERKLYVGNLPGDIIEAEVQEVFGLYGSIAEVHINVPKDGRTFRSAFVRFDDAQDAAAAMAVLSDMYKFRETTTPVRVNVARPAFGMSGGKAAGGKGYGDTGGINGNSNGFGAGAPPPATSQPPVATPPPPAATGSRAVGGPPAPPPPAPSSNWSGAGGPPNGGNNQWGDGYGRANGRPDGGRDWGSGSYSRDAGGGGGKDPISGRDMGSKLWVGNLPGYVTPQDIEEVFKNYGVVEDVSVLPNKSRSGQVCAFVHYAAPHQADACLQAVAQAVAQGYELKEGWGELKVERPGARVKGGGGYGGYDKGKGKKGYPY